jgi:protein TonB
VGERLARWAPLAGSALGHAALLAALAAGSAVAPAPRPVPAVIPVGRAPETAPAPRLRLAAADPADVAAGDGAADAPAVALDSADPRYRPYLLGVKQRIWERWGDPDPDAGTAARGTLVVEFTLTRRGAVAAAAVREPSGVPALDRAALAAVARAAPFLPLPDSIAGETLRVRARFVYD